MAKTKKKRVKRIGGGPMTKLVILLLAVLVGWQLWEIQGKLAFAQAENDRYTEEVARLQRENEALEADIAEGPSPEKVEQIARSELGLVTRNEYVFEDVTS